MRRKLALGCTFIIASAATLASSCGSSHAPTLTTSGDGGADGADGTEPDPHWFAAVADAGLVPVAVRGKSALGRMQGASCVLDVDGDGVLDLFLPSGIEGGVGTSKLYMGKGGWRFADETAARISADLGVPLGCLGVDIDGDGDDDLVTVGAGAPHLLINDAGKLVDKSSQLGPYPFVVDTISTAVVAFDADGDGALDLAISSYGHYDNSHGKLCGFTDCSLSPLSFQGGTTALLLQQADGTFTNASDRLGTFNEPGLVMVATDLNEDGHIDLFVGNDLPTNPDRYFAGDGAGHFVERGKPMGVAFDATLSGVCSMSASDVDLDVDGHLDIEQSNFSQKLDVAYLCKGASGCVDHSFELGFQPESNLRWGQAVADFDDDGVPDILEALSGLYTPDEYVLPYDAGAFYVPPISAPLQLLRRPNTSVPFAKMPAIDGLSVAVAGRGVNAFDLDGDGALDAVVGVSEGPPLLLRNVHPGRGRSLEVDLVGKGKNPHAIGARVTLTVAGRTTPAMVHAGGGYHGSVPPRLHFGLGNVATVDRIDVRFPDGTTTTMTSVPAGKVTIREP